MSYEFGVTLLGQAVAARVQEDYMNYKKPVRKPSLLKKLKKRISK
jgi:hypothetical protein